MYKRKFFRVFLVTFLVMIISGISTLFLLNYNYQNAEKKPDKTGNGEINPLHEEEISDVYSVKSEKIEKVEKEERVTEEPSGQNKTEETEPIEETAEKEEPITLLFAGDILFDDNYAVMSKLRSRGGEIEKAFSEEILKEMRDADFFVLNNEFVYSDRGTPIEGKAYTFRSKPKNVKYLTEMGVDLVSLANNHAYDYGEVSLLDTMDTLRGEGIAFIGAGKNLEEASEPYVLEENGMRISIVSGTQIERTDSPDTKGAKENSAGVFRCFHEKMIQNVVRKEREKSDYVIAYIHWGTESTAEIDWAQKELTKELCEAGVDLIIGNHPHVLQPIGTADGVPIIYSLGNFWFNSKAGDTCLVKVVLEKGKMISFQFLPARQENCFTKLLEGSEKDRVINYMRKISQGIEIDEKGMVNF